VCALPARVLDSGAECVGLLSRLDKGLGVPMPDTDVISYEGRTRCLDVHILSLIASTCCMLHVLARASVCLRRAITRGMRMIAHFAEPSFFLLLSLHISQPGELATAAIWGSLWRQI
jgi:hypothetical protein